MNRWFSWMGMLGMLALLSGCMATPVERSGGPGSVTIANSNPFAIASAAGAVFPRYGYTPGPGRFPDSISFERPAGRAGEAMFGSFNNRTTFRVRLRIVPIAGTPDFRVMPQVYRVSNAGQAGFEQQVPMMRSWSGQFSAILRDVRARAENSGPTF
jgi:hypothetical protein